jgi:DNA-binding SARP family transcriptional activator
LINPNANISTDVIIEELWGHSAPRSAAGTLQTYIYQLRKALNDMCDDGEGGALLTKPAGYQLRLGPHQLDAFEYEALAREGRAALADGDPGRASSLLHRALHLWRGRMLTDVECGTRLNAHIIRMEENRLGVLEQRITADMQIGRHRDLVGELKALVATYPLHEWFYAKLIIALHLSGRRSEALAVYQKLRLGLREELGLDPTMEIQHIHHAVLTDSSPSHLHHLSPVRASTA